MYTNSREHLLAELERIDLLIQSRVAMVRRLNGADEQFQGLYISEKELDQLLAAPIGVPRWAQSSDEEDGGHWAESLASLERHIREAVDRSRNQGIELRLPQLVQLCGLDPFDVDCVLTCLAPELDLRYQRIYAYLQDDVTKKRPSVDLVLNLLSSSLHEKLTLRDRFAGDAPLMKYRLVELLDDPSQVRSPLLAKHVRLDDRVLGYLLGSDALDSRILPYARKIAVDAPVDATASNRDLADKIQAFIERRTDGKQAVVYLQGPYGSGKQAVAETFCQARGLRLILADVEVLLRSIAESPLALGLDLLHRESLLQKGVLFFKGCDAFLTDEKRPLLDVFLQCLERWHGIVFLAGEAAWDASLMPRTSFIRVEMPPAVHSHRVRVWSAALQGHNGSAASLDIGGLGTKFRFTAGQIRDVVNTAESLAYWRGEADAHVNMQDLHEACRLHSNQKLRSLARKINSAYGWNDIVLPADQTDQLREICHQLKYRARVYEKWGFDQKLSRGKGLSVLFSGPSGTGKTMAAEVIAGELALDLYKIDLSTVVSKFIGETEKNLSKVFNEAETSNAILFFDEADALFGKRSEVKDSHDRYANIEIGYLLQRMEDYEGVVILATNFRKNMDEAFVRRLQVTVEFPFPGEADRRRIWEEVWPVETPRSADLDLDFMAKHCEITGGNIRNIALAAAFLAASDGESVGMDHVVRATQREYQKMGKIVSGGAFERPAQVTPSRSISESGPPKVVQGARG